MIRCMSFMAILLFLNMHSSVLAQLSSLSSEEIELILEVASEKFDSGYEEESLELFLRVLEADSKNYDALWTISIIYSRIGYRLNSGSEMEEYFEKAKSYAEKAIEYHSDKGRSYYVYAVALARLTDMMSKRDRIRAAHEIKENVEKAIEIEPDYAPFWHLYGVWHSDVANVSRVDRMAARFISGGVPRASNEKAEEYLKKAIQMDEERILFRMDLAKHYTEVGENEKAVEVLEKIREMKARTKFDDGKFEEVEKLLGRL